MVEFLMAVIRKVKLQKDCYQSVMKTTTEKTVLMTDLGLIFCMIEFLMAVIRKVKLQKDCYLSVMKTTTKMTVLMTDLG